MIYLSPQMSEKDRKRMTDILDASGMPWQVKDEIDFDDEPTGLTDDEGLFLMESLLRKDEP
jgi:hypothetical protein